MISFAPSTVTVVVLAGSFVTVVAVVVMLFGIRGPCFTVMAGSGGPAEVVVVVVVVVFGKSFGNSSVFRSCGVVTLAVCGVFG